MIAAATAVIATGCAASPNETADTTETSSVALSPPGSNHLQTANAPLKDLLTVGKHCFATGVEAVAAQLRAAAADAKADAEDDARQARGEMRLTGRDTHVVYEVEDNGTCYWVKTDSPFG